MLARNPSKHNSSLRILQVPLRDSFKKFKRNLKGVQLDLPRPLGGMQIERKVLGVSFLYSAASRNEPQEEACIVHEPSILG